jgi:peroxiredoxin
MKLPKTFAAALATLIVSASLAFAGLPAGSKAPDFTLNAALAGKEFSFSLNQQLKKGPVVLYFFPAAFTQGCTIEAHMFAEATPEFEQLGASVVGVTAGNVARVAEFSKSECRDKFAVAADPGAKVAALYDALMTLSGRTLSDRASFVIAPDGTILLSYTAMNPQHHIAKTMGAVRAWKAKQH